MLIQEDYFKNIFNTVHEAILILDENMKVLSANRSFYIIFKVDAANTIGSLLYDLGNRQWNIPYLRVLLEEILPKNNTVDDYEIEHNFESIGHKTMLLNACKIREKKNDQPIILLAIEDITERKRLEDLLTESEQRYRRAFETASDGIVLLEKREGNIINANPATEKMLGYSKDECIGKKLQDIGVSLDMSDFPTIMQALEKSGIINYDDVPVKTKSGQYIDTDIYMVDRVKLAQCNIRDVTERKQKEEDLQRLNRTLLARSKSGKAMMSARDEQWYLNEVCRIIVEDCGHALVWIGFAENDEGRTVKPMAHAGFEDGYLDAINITWSDTERGRGPVGTAIRTGKPAVFRNILASPTFAPWREDAVKRGYAAVIGVPLLAEGKAFGSLNIYSRHEDPFSDEEVQLLNDLATDLSYGIAAIRLRTMQAEAESALRKSEAQYRHLFDNMLEGYAYCKMFYIDDTPQDFVYIYVNKAFESLTGLKNVIGKKVSEVIPSIQESNPELLRIYGRVALTGKPERFETYVEPLGNWFSVAAYSTEKEYFVAVFDNITERKRTEETLRASERQYRELADNALVGVYKTTPEGRFLYVNDAMARIFECENADEMLRLPVGIRYKRPEDREAFLNILKERGEVPYYEIEVPTKTGKLKTIVISAVLDDGLITGMVTDITERKKAEDELRLFKNLINQANDAIFVVDPVTGRFLDMNVKACNNLGYDREELLKMAVWNIDDIAIPDTFSWKANVDNIKNEGHVFLEGRQRRKDGSTFSVEVNVRYISLEKSDYLVAVVRDITERKKADEELQRSEKRYKDLFDSTLDGIYQMDADGVFILMNPAGAKMFGYESPDEIIGRMGLEFWRDPRDRDAFRAELKIKKSVSGYPMRLKNKNGRPIELETSSTIKEDEKGAFLGMEGILRDVTERKKLEVQLRHAQKMEAVGTLAGGIAHDFNNILNVIIGYGSMVLDRLEDNSISKEQMNEVLAAAERAANLTKRLLTFSRKQLTEVKPIDVNDTVTGIHKMLVRIIGEDIDFNFDLADKRLVVMADAGQLEQALMNLATNARDAMPNGGRLTIGTGLEEIDYEYIAVNGYGRPGMYALITVADTGHGMDAETQKKIFEPFFTTKGLGEGTGLGLAISYGIIKQHNGYIKVYSEAGQGTVFKIYLPLIEESAFPDKKTEAPDAIKGGNETVLVAEDDAFLRDLSRIVLESFGYSVITAEDGEDAISKFMENRERIHLVMLDMIMPKKNGKEVSEVLRKASPGIKILFVSGYTMDIIKSKELTESGFDFIHKPIRSQDLLIKVREILDK